MGRSVSSWFSATKARFGTKHAFSGIVQRNEPARIIGFGEEIVGELMLPARCRRTLAELANAIGHSDAPERDRQLARVLPRPGDPAEMRPS